MIYQYNGDYYIKMARSFLKVNVTVKDNGDIVVKPNGKPVSVEEVYEFNYKPVTNEEIKNNFKKKVIVKEEVKEEVKEFHSFKKTNKFGKN